MSKENEKSESTLTRDQILSERDALRGMLKEAEDHAASLLKDKRALFMLSNVIGAFTMVDPKVAIRGMEYLHSLGMAPQLKEADDVLKATMECNCTACRYVMGAEVSDRIIDVEKSHPETVLH